MVYPTPVPNDLYLLVLGNTTNHPNIHHSRSRYSCRNIQRVVSPSPERCAGRDVSIRQMTQIASFLCFMGRKKGELGMNTSCNFEGPKFGVQVCEPHASTLASSPGVSKRFCDLWYLTGAQPSIKQ